MCFSFVHVAFLNYCHKLSGYCHFPPRKSSGIFDTSKNRWKFTCRSLCSRDAFYRKPSLASLSQIVSSAWLPISFKMKIMDGSRSGRNAFSWNNTILGHNLKLTPTFRPRSSPVGSSRLLSYVISCSHYSAARGSVFSHRREEKGVLNQHLTDFYS